MHGFSGSRICLLFGLEADTAGLAVHGLPGGAASKQTSFSFVFPWT